ncbi:MAG: hypothetical protein M3N98_07270 [Actinomycetota bacterium]|nr:hypothetical protein [Actinomycetota bacterium]
MSQLDSEGLAYRARALAQAHPLTPLAKQYLDRAVANEGSSQPMPEIGMWAGAALLTGYCVRRVEEEDLGLRPSDNDRPPVSLDQLDEAAGPVAVDLRGGSTEEPSPTLGHDSQSQRERLIGALDRVVGSEVSRRLDNWRDNVDDQAWVELEDYITWWVVKGYAIRVAEIALGAAAR